jgi:hypothetical protein
MSTAKLTIENKIRDLILAAPAPLDALKVVVRGVAYKMPSGLYPFAQVFITGETTASELSGNYKERVYQGAVTIQVSQADTLAVVDRKADVGSYTLVQELVDAVVELLSQPANATLGGLTFDNGTVNQFLVGESEIEYGIADSDSRQNNYENFGAIPFLARTTEVIA